MEAVEIENRFVRLAPLGNSHTEALLEAAMESDIWKYLPKRLDSMDAMESWISAHLEQRQKGTRLPFAVFNNFTGQVVGSTSFLNYDAENRSIEIGWTWLRRTAWGTAINPAKKLLMMEYCFNELDCVRVQFKTDAQNKRSRMALEKIGANYEGTLRSHMKRADGSWRDSAFFSVIEPEWPPIKTALEKKLHV